MSNATAEPIKPRYAWRSWEKMDGEDLVEMPRTLALDLIKALDITPFLTGATDEECMNEVPREKFEAHRERMEKILSTLSIHLAHEVDEVSADLLLRALVMTYEAAPDIPAN